jgi:hypothetical protein
VNAFRYHLMVKCDYRGVWIDFGPSCGRADTLEAAEQYAAYVGRVMGWEFSAEQRAVQQ